MATHLQQANLLCADQAKAPGCSQAVQKGPSWQVQGKPKDLTRGATYSRVHRLRLCSHKHGIWKEGFAKHWFHLQAPGKITRGAESTIPLCRASCRETSPSVRQCLRPQLCAASSPRPVAKSYRTPHSAGVQQPQWPLSFRSNPPDGRTRTGRPALLHRQRHACLQ